MSDPGKAVFLSYASQDAEAARRIADTLRAAGVEVWFDQSELAGGDAWDARIRRQIASCALFVPVISANTQARLEGYFRIEWKLAAQRTHAMADEKAFLLPVVIDGTGDAGAKVPAEFKAVQWTHLPAGGASAAFCERVRHLLAGEVAGETRRRFDETRTKDATTPATASNGAGWRRFALPVAALLLAVAGLTWWVLPSLPSTAGSGASAAKATPVATEADRLVDRARAMRLEGTDDMAVAEELTRRATDIAPDSARAWAARARMQSAYIVRGWDVSEKRRQDTQAAANRALVLDSDNTEAMIALATVFNQQGAFTQSEALMRRAMTLAPNESASRRALGVALSGQGRTAEALALRQESLRLFPRDPMSHYDLALSFEKAEPPDLEAALRKFEESLALERLTSTRVHIASLQAGWKGDLAAARRVLGELDPVERTGDRAVGVAMMIALLEGQPGRVAEAGGLTARSYLDDSYVRGPKAWLLAHAYRRSGKETLARGQWQAAESVLRQRLRDGSASSYDEAGLAVTLAWLGSTEEALRLGAAAEAVARESPRELSNLYLAYFHAGFGDAAKAVPFLRRVLNRRELVTDRTLPLDPWWDKLRGQPEFEALRSAAPK